MHRLLAAGFVLLVTAVALAQDRTAETEEARAVIQRLRGAMIEHLQAAMADSGPELCRHLAPESAGEIEAETGWQIRRTSLRVRNPDNRPTDAERGILMSYAARRAAGQSMELMETTRIVEQDGESFFEYFRAIPTFEPCLACHGDAPAPDVAAAIREHYPDDEAVGFAVGDLRGIFSLRRPWRPGEAIETGDLTGAKPVELPAQVQLGIGTLSGDAARGRQAFDKSCQRCHAPSDLAVHIFRPTGEPLRQDVCVFLETHGLLDSERDCDVVAYLKTLAGAAE
ncbi:MAG: DUF3365 domain-containing protein [Inquilinus sp.]|nr:DUF3365 domain-containing protein [Inquilinus sp.]